MRPFILIFFSLTPLFWPLPALANEDTQPSSLAEFFENKLGLCQKNSLQRKGCERARNFLTQLIAHDSSNLSFRGLREKLHQKKIEDSEWVIPALNAWISTLDPHAELLLDGPAEGNTAASPLLVEGAGARLRVFHGRLLVAYPLEGSAAEKAGLSEGDQILSLNNYNLEHTNETIVDRVLNKSKSPFQLTIYRKGRLLQKSFVGKRYQLAPVNSWIKKKRGKKVGVLRVRSFETPGACDQVRAEIRWWQNRVTEWELDLRNNPGGLVQEALCVAGLFLGPSREIAGAEPLFNPEIDEVFSLPENEGQEEKLLTIGSKETSLPVVVHLNQNSASSAELLAAALIDTHRATSMGVRSFGKGTIQSEQTVLGAPSLRLVRTTHRIIRITGQTLHGSGISPTRATARLEGPLFPREAQITQ